MSLNCLEIKKKDYDKQHEEYFERNFAGESEIIITDVIFASMMVCNPKLFDEMILKEGQKLSDGMYLILATSSCDADWGIVAEHCANTEILKIVYSRDSEHANSKLICNKNTPKEILKVISK